MGTELCGYNLEAQIDETWFPKILFSSWSEAPAWIENPVWCKAKWTSLFLSSNNWSGESFDVNDQATTKIVVSVQKMR